MQNLCLKVKLFLCEDGLFKAMIPMRMLAIPRMNQTRSDDFETSEHENVRCKVHVVNRNEAVSDEVLQCIFHTIFDDTQLCAMIIVWGCWGVPMYHRSPEDAAQRLGDRIQGRENKRLPRFSLAFLWPLFHMFRYFQHCHSYLQKQ